MKILKNYLILNFIIIYPGTLSVGVNVCRGIFDLNIDTGAFDSFDISSPIS